MNYTVIHLNTRAVVVQGAVTELIQRIAEAERENRMLEVTLQSGSTAYLNASHIGYCETA